MRHFKGLLLALLVLLAATAVACGPSPAQKAHDFARYLPAKAGDWTRDDKKTVELPASTVAGKGHVTLQYEGPDQALAFIVIEAHPSEDAAAVASVSRQRELLMQGLTFAADRAAKQVTAQVAQQERTRYALLQDSNVVVEIDVLAAEGADPVSDDAFDQLLTLVRSAYAKAVEE